MRKNPAAVRRLNLIASPAWVEVLERAAEKTGESVSEFLRKGATTRMHLHGFQVPPAVQPMGRPKENGK